MTPTPRPRPRPTSGRGRRPVVAGRTAVSVAVAEREQSADSVEEPVGDDELIAASATEAEQPGGSPPRPGLLARTSVLVGLAVGVVLAIAAAVVAVAGAGAASEEAAAANRAVVDAAATSAVTGQISDGVETVFSFDSKDMAKTERAAQELLTGDAIAQYNTLYGQLKQLAPAQGLTLSTKVKSIAVQTLTGDRADVLVFADQQATRAGADAPSVGGAQLRLLAAQAGGKWRIAGITVL